MKKKVLIFTHDPVVTYELNNTHNPNWVICSYFEDALHHTKNNTVPATFKPDLVINVHSFLGSFLSSEKKVRDFYHAVEEKIETPKTTQIGRDPDVYLKKRMPGFSALAPYLEAYRFTLVYGEPTTQDATKWQQDAITLKTF